jgi:hypothetical protein
MKNNNPIPNLIPGQLYKSEVPLYHIWIQYNNTFRGIPIDDDSFILCLSQSRIEKVPHKFIQDNFEFHLIDFLYDGNLSSFKTPDYHSSELNLIKTLLKPEL